MRQEFRAPGQEKSEHEQLTDALVELIALAQSAGHPMTIALLKMALLNEVQGSGIELH